MRRFLSSACFSLGIIWAAAGIGKLLFGTELTLPGLPPLGLQHVSVIPSIGAALALFALGAAVGRRTISGGEPEALNQPRTEAKELNAEAHEGAIELSALRAQADAQLS